MTKHPSFRYWPTPKVPDRLSRALIVGLLAAQAGCGAPPNDGPTAETASEESGLEAAFNGYGVGSSLHTSGAIDTTNPFFQALGTNPRSCATCH